MSLVKFFKKTKDEIDAIEIVDGQLFFETDQGNNSIIQLDHGTERLAVGGKTPVEDSLNSTSTIFALSANQGRILNDKSNNQYTHVALGVLTGLGTHGFFVSGFDGTVSSFSVNGTIIAVKAGEETEIELIAGVMYWFTISGDTINFRQGGASRNYKIVASTTQPTNPKENTIWVNTSVPIPSNGWAFANENPYTAPTVGNVWLQTKDTATIELSTSKNVLEQQKINNIYQFDGTEWVATEASIYQNGEWISFKTWVYDNGTFNQMAEPLAVNPSNGVTYNVGNFQLGSSGVGWIKWATAQMDMTEYSQLRIKYSHPVTGESKNLFIIKDWQYTNPASGESNDVARLILQETGANIVEQTLDISAVVGEYRIGIRTYAPAGAFFYEMELIS